MADIAKSGTPSLCSVEPQQGDSITGLVAGEALGAFDACYIKSDGKAWKATAAAADVKVYVRGYAARAVAAGAPITLYRECRASYGAAMTPGANVYLSAATAGALADAASENAPHALGYVVDATRVQLWETREYVAPAP
jgi:hypothetical protein